MSKFDKQWLKEVAEDKSLDKYFTSALNFSTKTEANKFVKYLMKTMDTTNGGYYIRIVPSILKTWNVKASISQEKLMQLCRDFKGI